MSDRSEFPVASQHQLFNLSVEKQHLIDRLQYTIGKDPVDATSRDWLFALVYLVRDLVTNSWVDTQRRYYLEDAKRIYYLSMEFLIGRSLSNALLNLGCRDEIKEVLEDLGLDLEELCDLEEEAGLGNGGLGRLAACFLDSLATLQLPGFGYGLRYEYGMFSQGIENGYQVEHPDNWLRYGDPWEYPRSEVLYRVQFRGHVAAYVDQQGRDRCQWHDGEHLMAMAYDLPIPGYSGRSTNNMRLWVAKASRDFDLKYFNEGNYIRAVEEKNRSENLTRVLYPDDTTQMGRELRLRQEYFFVSASVQDIVKSFLTDHENLRRLPEEVAIQLNDTHPALAIAELMRVLLDEHGLVWDDAWDTTVRTFSYTNHTLQPEALETWPVALFEDLLPRHLQIIYQINVHFLQEVAQRFPNDGELIRRVSLIDEDHGRRVRMAYLAVVGSHKVNGVAAIHSQLMRTTTFSDFYRLFPERFINITNGVTPRRWLNQCNPGLAGLISEAIGTDWIADLEQLGRLQPLASDGEFCQRFAAVKRAAKERLVRRLENSGVVGIDPATLFDVQIKRIHEYKRQLLNLLHVITRYNRLCAQPHGDCVPRTVIVGGKAAPGYAMAKLIIKLIHDVAAVVNNDPRVAGRLRLVFVANYNVSRAMELVPAVDLSEQISTAGTEASGTSNMKMMMNGALTIGTLDGANVEICEAVGVDNIFIFGQTTDQLAQLRQRGYDPWDYYRGNEELRQALDMLGNGFFSPDQPDRFQPIIDALLHGGGDRYAVLADYADYVATQDRVDALYRDTQTWHRKAILNVAASGRFSSDRAILQYAREVWGIETG